VQTSYHGSEAARGKPYGAFDITFAKTVSCSNHAKTWTASTISRSSLAFGVI